MNMIREDFVPFSFERRTPAEMQARAAEFYHLMDHRRTVREFSSDPIPDGVIENVVATAGTAPSGAHKQPWYFCVVRDAAVKREIRLAAEKEEEINYHQRFTPEWLEDLAPLGTDEHKQYLENAPVVLVVFRVNYRTEAGKRKKNYYVQESCGIAAGMLIAAIHNAGLVTLTHTPSPMGFMNEILGRPKNEVAMLVMPIGYPLEHTRVPDLTRKPLAEIMKVY